MEVIKRILRSKRVITAVVMILATAAGVALSPEITEAIVLILSTVFESQ